MKIHFIKEYLLNAALAKAGLKEINAPYADAKFLANRMAEHLGEAGRVSDRTLVRCFEDKEKWTDTWGYLAAYVLEKGEDFLVFFGRASSLWQEEQRIGIKPDWPIRNAKLITAARKLEGMADLTIQFDRMIKLTPVDDRQAQSDQQRHKHNSGRYCNATVSQAPLLHSMKCGRWFGQDGTLFQETT